MDTAPNSLLVLTARYCSLDLMAWVVNKPVIFTLNKFVAAIGYQPPKGAFWGHTWACPNLPAVNTVNFAR